MLKELILATQNKGKIAELEELLAPLNIKLITAHDIDLPEVAETGDTFKANAQLKAEAIAAHTGKPTLADDSGLCVAALDGAPGVYSARYGGYEKLLQKLADVEFAQRDAHFMCVLALAQPGRDTQFFEGRVDGFILTEARGQGGFGYDPVFLPAGGSESYAENPAQKKSHSHRTQALHKLVKTLR